MDPNQSTPPDGASSSRAPAIPTSQKHSDDSGVTPPKKVRRQQHHAPSQILLAAKPGPVPIAPRPPAPAYLPSPAAQQNYQLANVVTSNVPSQYFSPMVTVMPQPIYYYNMPSTTTLIQQSYPGAGFVTGPNGNFSIQSQQLFPMGNNFVPIVSFEAAANGNGNGQPSVTVEEMQVDVGGSNDEPVNRGPVDSDDDVDPPSLIAGQEAVVPEAPPESIDDQNKLFIKEVVNALKTAGVTADSIVRKHTIDGWVLEESSEEFPIPEETKEEYDLLAEPEPASMETDNYDHDHNYHNHEDDDDDPPQSGMGVVVNAVGEDSSITPDNNEDFDSLDGDDSSDDDASYRGGSSRKKRKSSGTSPRKISKKSPPATRKKSTSAAARGGKNKKHSSTTTPQKVSPSSSSENKQSRGDKEIQRLLGMDFGPGKTPFKTTSVTLYRNEVHREQILLRPMMQPDSPTVSDLVDVDAEYDPETSPKRGDDLCFHCHQVFNKIQKRSIRHPQYCSDRCYKTYRSNANRRKFKVNEMQKKGGASTFSAGETASGSGMTSRASSSSGKRPTTATATSPISNPPSVQKSSTPKSNSTPVKVSPSKQQQSPAKSKSTGQAAAMVTPFTSPMRNSSHASPSTPGNLGSSATDYRRIRDTVGLSEKLVTEWSVDDVQRYINGITASTTIGVVFGNEEVDGESLLLLEYDLITQGLGIKMGPAMKIMKAIRWLKDTENGEDAEA